MKYVIITNTKICLPVSEIDFFVPIFQLEVTIAAEYYLQDFSLNLSLSLIFQVLSLLPICPSSQWEAKAYIHPRAHLWPQTWYRNQRQARL